jgi:long-chain acyl-CoA synthetase
MLDLRITAEKRAHPVSGVSRNVPEMFLKRTARTPHRPAWKRKLKGEWISTSWHEFYEAAAATATFLLERGLRVGDKVTICGGTGPEWCIADIGGLLAGAVTVGAYATLTSEQLAYILDHSDSRVAFVEGREQLAKILEQRARLPRLELIVVWDDAGIEDLLKDNRDVVRFLDVLETPAQQKRIDARVAEVTPDLTAIIVYTSGTTGPPKGAMISHENILTFLAGTNITEFDEDDVNLVFLPMAHVAERVASFYGRINYATCAAFASSVPSVLDELKEVKPSLFGSVPRIFEKGYARIQSEVDKAPTGRQRAFRWAERTGLEVVERWQSGQKLPLALRLKYKLADRLVFSKIRDIFGGRVKYFITGAAPIPRAVLEFFWAAGFPIFEVYGMTEATVITHGNRPGEVRLGSVGKALEFIEDKIADDGEILLRGKVVFQGYYKDPEATAEAIDAEGWLHTGDIGKKDADGFLYIVDRKKHIIITAGGKNLTPANIENEIKTRDSIISQVHAHGDRRPYVTALVTVGAIDAIELAKEKGILTDLDQAEQLRTALLENPLSRPEGLTEVMAKVTSLPELRSRIASAVERGNQKLSRVEQVKRVVLLDREFSLEEDEITPTLKAKRKNIEKKFAPIFDRLYTDESFGITVQKASE